MYTKARTRAKRNVSDAKMLRSIVVVEDTRTHIHKKMALGRDDVDRYYSKGWSLTRPPLNLYFIGCPTQTTKPHVTVRGWLVHDYGGKAEGMGVEEAIMLHVRLSTLRFHLNFSNKSTSHGNRETSNRVHSSGNADCMHHHGKIAGERLYLVQRRCSHHQPYGATGLHCFVAKC